MSSTSVRRSMLVYAVVFSAALAFAVATFASGAIIRAARDTAWSAADREVYRLAGLGEAAALAPLLDGDQRRGLVALGQPAFGLEIEDARALVVNPAEARDRGFAVAMLRGPGADAYLVERVELGAALASAQAEIRPLIVGAMIAAIAIGVLTALMIARLVLPPLSALRRALSSVALEDLAPSDTPNEIAEVAQAFRRTLRKLEEDRERIEAQHRALEAMQSSLVRASKLASVGRLAAGVAHEIGNPLAAVRGYLSLLDGGLAEPDRREVLARSAAELNRIHDTIKKLLSYARKDDEAGPAAPFSTAGVVRDALILLRGHPALAGVAIEDRLEDQGLDALGHAGPLGQVVVNLVLNAAQAMSASPDKRIVVERARSAETIELQISDRGPGVEPERAEQIFDPFYTTKAPGEGTGLGLAVSRAIMERMDGDLYVEPAPGGGARFVARLPAAFDTGAEDAIG